MRSLTIQSLCVVQHVPEYLDDGYRFSTIGDGACVHLRCDFVRVIRVGAGAVGSVSGGRLRQGGADVVMVSRPAHVSAIRERGLTLRTAKDVDVVDVDAVASIEELPPTAV